MSIKRKRTGPAPIYSERWQVMATDPDRLTEAMREYRATNPGANFVQASRAVRTFHQTHIQRHGNKR